MTVDINLKKEEKENAGISKYPYYSFHFKQNEFLSTGVTIV